MWYSLVMVWPADFVVSSATECGVGSIDLDDENEVSHYRTLLQLL